MEIARACAIISEKAASTIWSNAIHFAVHSDTSFIKKENHCFLSDFIY